MNSLETLALDLYRRAGIDPERQTGAMRIALALGLDVQFVPGVQWQGRYRDRDALIELRANLSDARADFVCGHELGHLVLDGTIPTLGIETSCDHFAGLIVAPSPALRVLVRAFGFDVRQIAEALGVSEGLARLRLGDVFGTAAIERRIAA